MSKIIASFMTQKYNMSEINPVTVFLYSGGITVTAKIKPAQNGQKKNKNGQT